MDYILSRELLTSATGIYLMLFPIRLVGFSLLEKNFTAYHYKLRDVLLQDIVIMFLIVILGFPVAQYVSNAIGPRLPLPFSIDSLPLALRVALYLVVADFGHYWVHRLLHQPMLWPVHRWHHSPNHTGWASGVRATLQEAILVNLAYIFAWPLLGTTTHRLEMLLLIFVVLKNDWMHLNVSWRLPWLEWLIVTPRYHHIHHSERPEHHDRNLAVLLSGWDRLFGTYVDPDTVACNLEFGTGEATPSWRLVAGV